jgi:hypothetical protein
MTRRESEDVCVPPWEYKHENGMGTVQRRSSTRDPDNVLNPPFQRPEVEESGTTHVVNTTETSESSSAPRRSTKVLLGDFDEVSSMPVTTGRDNNVETDPALQGICEIGAATLPKQELKEKIVEQSTAITKEAETMRGLYWQGVGRTLAPPPGDIVERSINLRPTGCNKQWREWAISVAKDYFDQNDPASVEHINNDSTMACEMLVAAHEIIGPSSGWDMRIEQINWLCNDETHHVSPNAIMQVDDLDIYTVSDSTRNMTGAGKSGKKQNIEEELRQRVKSGSCKVDAYSGAMADVLIDRIIVAAKINDEKEQRKATPSRRSAPCHMEPQRSLQKGQQPHPW